MVCNGLRVSTIPRDLGGTQRIDPAGGKKKENIQHTLAKKFDVVQSTTTARSRQIPRVRLPAAPKRRLLALEDALMGLSKCWSICDSGCNNGVCIDGVVSGALAMSRRGCSPGMRGFR